MKVPEKLIERLCQKIILQLKDKKLIQVKVPEDKVIARMVQAIQEDLSKEALIDQEARKMLEKYRSTIDRGEIEEHKMFQMIKKQLIKDKKIIL